MDFSRVILCFLIFFIQGVSSAQWFSSSPQDGLSIYTCVGDSVTVAWRYILASGDVLGDKEWLFNGHSNELIAVYSHGNFFPTPPFSQRVEATDNAGIVLRKVVVDDSGNYTVEVNGHDSSGVYFQIRRYVVLHVIDHLVTTDGQLHVTMTSEAVVNTATNQMNIELTCGTFLFADTAPFAVQWITPSGQILTSSGFYDHQFRLYLPAAIEDGNYTCSVPQNQAAHACLQGYGGEGQASVYVSKADARLAILEKKYQMQQQTFQQQLQMANVQLSTMQQTVQNLQVANATLQHDITDLKTRAGRQVAFHAIGLLSNSPAANTPLIFHTVHYNIGQAYNASTGYVVAPYGGVYFVIVTTGPYNQHHGEFHSIYVDNTQVAWGYSYKDTTNYNLVSAHAAVHVRQGQKIWVRSNGDTYTDGYFVTFSGFLVCLDP